MPRNDELHADVEAVLAELRADPAKVAALYGPSPSRGAKLLAEQLAAATARAERAERAEQELDDKTVALGEAESWITRYAIERDQARSRAERAEAALAKRDQQYDEACQVLANVRESLELVGQNFDKHDATIDRVRALAHHWADLPGSEFPFAEAADTLTAALDYIEPAKGAPGVICGPCSLGRHGDCDWDEQTPPQRCHCACLALAALDGTDG
jgi:DNA repair exonuclease SbcCD ATPase subunit